MPRKSRKANQPQDANKPEGDAPPSSQSSAQSSSGAPPPASSRRPQATAPLPSGSSSRPQSTAPLPSTSSSRPQAMAPPPFPEMMQSLSISSNAPPSSSKALVPPRRPPRPATAGTRCLVNTNHFLIQLHNKELFHYDVAITPEVQSRGKNRVIIRELIRLYKDSNLGKRLPAYDGRKSLYAAGSFPFTSKDFVVKLSDEAGSSSLPSREKEYKVTIRFAASFDLHHLQQFLQGMQMDCPQEAIQALDVVLRELPSRNYTPVGRSFFSSKFGKEEIGDGLECWRGFYQSIRPTQMGLSLNTDVSTTAFYEPVPVISFVSKLFNKDPPKQFSDAEKVKVKKALRGVKIEVTHTPAKRRYRVSGITRESTNQLAFSIEEQGTRTTVVQYFRDKYNYHLRYANWPALEVGNDRKKTYMPMEVCKIVEGQRYTKKLNEKQVTAILRASCQRPREREQKCIDMIRNSRFSEDPFAREFGIRVSDSITTVDARVLPPPRLKYHDSGKEKDCTPRVGQWNMINKKMVNPGAVPTWVCINFSRVNFNAVQGFCQDLVTMCRNMGMDFNPRPFLPIENARPDQVEKLLMFVHQKTAGTHLTLLIVILPEVTGSSYGQLKCICETQHGIVSQCCKPRNVTKPNRQQYLENVALKINVKVGGRNSVLVDALTRRIPMVSDVPTIIFGADVTHPPPGEDSSPSISAVVASQDWPEVTKYMGLVSAQSHRREIIADLYTCQRHPTKGLVHGGMIRDLLISFKIATRQKPQRIIFYRDGVSEGQFNQVLLEEMDAIRKACASLEEGYLPPVTFIVCQKRHHTRLFTNNHNNQSSVDRSGNILPGTVVDTKICHPSEFDFYLCSHAGIQGTSRPAHYHVLYDENSFSADGLQSLTNNLCYTYARCTRSVSIVPPAYYAHLAAFRARYYLEASLSEDGSSAGGLNRQAGDVAIRPPLPAIKENVKQVMFFC
ncbi:hypothetical protein AMTRI_Chr03g147670 [Amborella trichopoda]|uniref:Uncharacterized protein n=1 Tax=Amborella trichopoda TaxID=13333 RepID=W1P392_AMBTC|nr:protein argonaute 1A [Amborella trichopoda]XP_020520179.1 protein argonaute 1A [Amborella trichopoda]XP_020520180.1 protein argonaute 1A [Amborella trichopoda]ERN01425.1 hypothetical protein AMTR_s00002p00265690 [Amborella trichopoda]|eukprot:XP_006838856.1 protein argonaute 1A [Amborella trichopoda]